LDHQKKSGIAVGNSGRGGGWARNFAGVRLKSLECSKERGNYNVSKESIL
jgi:hypothetical protein